MNIQASVGAFFLRASIAIVAVSISAAAQTYSWGHPDSGAPIPFRNGDLMGYMDSSKNVVIPARYDLALRFYDGLAEVHIGKKAGFIDVKGKLVIDIKYAGASSFLEGMAPVTDGRKWGFVDRNGKLAIPMIYDSADHFNEGRAGVQLKQYWGFIDKAGKVIVPIKYTRVGYFLSGRAMVETTTKGTDSNGETKQKIRKGYVDSSGKIAIPIKYYYAGDFSDDAAHVRIDDPKRGLLDGFIDRIGTVLIQFDEKNYECSDFSEGIAWADGKYISRSGRVVIDPKGKYNFADIFHDGLAAIVQEGKIGYINKAGDIVIPSIYQDGRADSGLGAFSEGLAPVKVDGKFGYIDKNGKIVIEPKYDKALPFESGLGWVQLGSEGNVFFVGRDGTEYRIH